MTVESNPATPAAPSFAVVLCAYTADRWADILAAVESVRQQTLTPAEIVVVVDHNDELMHALREALPPDIRVVANEGRRGLADARNTGVAHCSAELVAFLDDDAVAHARWLERLARHYPDPQVAGVGGSVLPNWCAGRPRWMPEEFDWVVGCTYRGAPTTTTDVRNFIGANMSFRRSALDRVGGFTGDLGRVGSTPLGCEETDLCIRLRQLTAESVLRHEPAAVVHHSVPRSRGTWRYFVSRCRSEGRSKALLARRVGRQSALATERSYVRRTLLAGTLGGVRGIASRRALSSAGQTAAIVIGLLMTVLGYVEGMVGRRRARLGLR